MGKPVRCSCCQQEKTGKGAHGFPCHCMERRVCVACDHCEEHCKCAEPVLAESYVSALEGMRAELRGEALVDRARQTLREERAA
jgi:hypothetical protein